MSQYQFSAPPLTRLNKMILISTGVVFLLGQLLRAIGAAHLPQWIGLSGSGLTSGLVYQLVTYPLMETEPMGFLFNALVVWFIGSELESQWGSKVYIRFLLMNVVVVGIIFALVSITLFHGTQVYFTPLKGLTGINFALLMAYAYLYPDRQMSMMMIFPMRAKTFCWILAGIEAYMAIFSGFAAAWAHLLTMGSSLLILKLRSRSVIKKALYSDYQLPSNRSKPKLRVVKDDDEKPPKFWQ